jgi:hypothetical protein
MPVFYSLTGHAAMDWLTVWGNRHRWHEVFKILMTFLPEGVCDSFQDAPMSARVPA